MPLDYHDFPLTYSHPPGGGTVGRPATYPFEIMKVGQSFFAPGRNYVTTASAARRYGFRFAQSIRTEDGVLGARVWRVA